MLAWRREQRRGELVVQAQHGAGSTFLCLAFGVGGDGGGASFSQFSLTPVFTFFELVPQAVSPAGTCAQLAVCDDPASTTCPAIRLSFVKDGHSANVVSYLWKHDDHTPSNPWEVPRFALGLVPDLGRRRLDVPCCKYGSRDGAECRPLRDAAPSATRRCCRRRSCGTGMRSTSGWGARRRWRRRRWTGSCVRAAAGAVFYGVSETHSGRSRTACCCGLLRLLRRSLACLQLRRSRLKMLASLRSRCTRSFSLPRLPTPAWWRSRCMKEAAVEESVVILVGFTSVLQELGATSEATACRASSCTAA